MKEIFLDICMLLELREFLNIRALEVTMEKSDAVINMKIENFTSPKNIQKVSDKRNEYVLLIWK